MLEHILLHICKGGVEVISNAIERAVEKNKRVKALRAFNSGNFDNCVERCNTLIREQGHNVNISLPDFHGKCSQLRDQALQNIDELKRLTSDLQTAKNNKDWPAVKRICQSILALRKEER